MIVRVPTSSGHPMFKIIQVKFTNQLKPEAAMNTTDFKRFYCKRSDGSPLKGFQKSHKKCVQFFKEQSIERIVIHQGKVRELEDKSVCLINKEKDRTFFDCLDLKYDVWKMLEEMQYYLNQ